MGTKRCEKNIYIIRRHRRRQKFASRGQTFERNKWEEDAYHVAQNSPMPEKFKSAMHIISLMEIWIKFWVQSW